MAITYRDLWPEVVAWDNLLAAYHRCRRRKRFRAEAARFDFDWESQLVQLQQDLIDKTYQPGTYRHFYVLEPKRRKISAAPFRDRIVHHAIVGVLEPLYERRFLHDSYTCRKGKGTHRALDRAQLFLRRHHYFLKTDIVRFFPNVDHEVLLSLLGRTIRDERLMNLIRNILASGEGVLAEEATPSYFPGDDLLAILRPTGLPIGNLTSQFFANVLLDPIDHFVKEELRIPGYARYADDLVLFDDDKFRLWHARQLLSERLADFRLRLHRDKTQLRPCEHGLKFLGFKLERSGRRLQQTVVRRFNLRLRFLQREFADGRINADAIGRSIHAWLAHIRDANTSGLRRSLWRRVRFQRRYERWIR
jgi:retron-type reverse transcriptase